MLPNSGISVPALTTRGIVTLTGAHEIFRKLGTVPALPAFALMLIEELQPEVAARDSTLTAVNQPPTVSVLFNPKRLSRLFFNLIGNALNAMPDGGAITLRFATGENELSVAVTDSGRGIPPDIAGNLFQPFATHGKAKGTGLGLAICKKIVESHGGRIWAHNEPAGGATFSFTLPLAQV